MISKVISHFKILEKLGEGGMGVVYKAHDTKLDRLVALKFLPSHVTANETDKARFLQEAKAAAAIDHTNVCVIHEIREYEDQQYIVMEYVEGVTLAEKIKSGPLGLKDVIEYAMQIGEGLKAAHSKFIVHRDIKSSNIMVTSTKQIKIMDFGLAKLKGLSRLTKTASTVGTIGYMSPERLQNKEVDARSDIFSFGVVLYEMLTGQLPFKGEYESAMMYSILNEEPEPVQKLRPELSSEFLHLLNRTLEKDPEDRYQTVKEVVIDLKRVKRDVDGVMKRPVSPYQTKEGEERPILENKVGKKYVRSKTNKVGIVSVSLIMIMLFVWFLSRMFFNPRPEWMNMNTTTLKQITSEQGLEFGRISPDGKYLAYIDEKDRLLLKELSRGIVTNISPVDSGGYFSVAWYPESTYLVAVPDTSGFSSLYILNTMGKIIDRIQKENSIYHPAWSPDGSKIAYGYGEYPPICSIIVMDYQTKEEKRFFTANNVFQLCWSPDSRKIAYLEFRRIESRSGVLRILDAETGINSEPLPHVNNACWFYKADGLTWSPDGEYVVYVGKVDSLNPDHNELYAVPIDQKRISSMGPPIRITKTDGFDIPAYPTFTKDGEKLSYIRYRSDHNIYSIPISFKDLKISGPLTEIATSTGRDDEPSWTGDGAAVLYSSNKEGQWDIYQYNLESQEDRRLTMSGSIEHYPKEAPDGRSITYIESGKIWSIPRSGGKASLISPENLHLDGPYAWMPDGKYIIAYLIEDSTYLISLHTETGDYRRLLKMTFKQNTSKFAISHDGKKLVTTDIFSPDNLIERVIVLDLITGKHNNIFTQSGSGPRGNIMWMEDNIHILHDRRDANGKLVYELLDTNGGEPKKLKLDIGNLRGETFLQNLDPSEKNLLIRIWSEESNIFLWEAE